MARAWGSAARGPAATIVSNDMRSAPRARHACSNCTASSVSESPGRSAATVVSRADSAHLQRPADSFHLGRLLTSPKLLHQVVGSPPLDTCVYPSKLLPDGDRDVRRFERNRAADALERLGERSGESSRRDHHVASRGLGFGLFEIPGVGQQCGLRRCDQHPPARAAESGQVAYVGPIGAQERSKVRCLQVAKQAPSTVDLRVGPGQGTGSVTVTVRIATEVAPKLSRIVKVTV